MFQIVSAKSQGVFRGRIAEARGSAAEARDLRMSHMPNISPHKLCLFKSFYAKLEGFAEAKRVAAEGIINLSWHVFAEARGSSS